MRYPNGTEALRGLDLEVRAGELVVILGGNGCGKTTLLRSITRAVKPTAGQVWLNGRDLVSLEGEALRSARMDLAMIWQQANLVRRRSVIANIACGALGRNRTWWTALGGLPNAELPAAYEALGQVGLAHLAPQRAGTLSGGQAQRVSIARALMQRPSVLLADEPVASLDPEAATDIMRLLQRLARHDGLAVLCVLHQVDLAFGFADRIVGMRAGRAVFDRPTGGVSSDEVQELYQKRAA
ncbi:MAG TPA: phosphonate ABC transporter ATP-binding protein [Rhodopila sp.]|uniref:phosphonate ABC transporter ATP-binding protein n=1 Tax=Rhodopila sp. TaxID=2480087 RepID=UPI002C4175BF|nr:phosphonate ABC transporter ATP-binding protein [Rhodopila sp.]HVY14625.1 phosphonate ABC transporter ATP-binding protein [Rhodopila sp.]